MALSHFAYARRNVISSGVAVAMAATIAFPAVALADAINGSEGDSAASHSAGLEAGVSVDEAAASSAGESQTNYVAETTGVQVNKEDYYSEEGSPEALMSLFSMGRSASGLRPVNLSSDVTYFGAYEGGSYAQTLSSGDGFHAVGYYQFDNRYGLLDFIRAVYAYDPSKYSMFEQFNYVADSTFKADNAMRQNGQFTALGVALNSSWKAAYAADAEEFSRLQDGWEYIKYIEPALDYLDSRGIDIYSRADAVQGLCASLCNLFGPSGWHKFVGGYSDGYDWNGFYNSWKYWDGCGLNNDMTDAEFVNTLCDYVVENVGVFYKGQPQYHQGWQNRYKREKAQCLAMIAEHGDTHVKADEPTQPSEPSNGGVASGGSVPNGDSASNGNDSSASGAGNGSSSSSEPSGANNATAGGNSGSSKGDSSSSNGNANSNGAGAGAASSGGVSNSTGADNGPSVGASGGSDSSSVENGSAGGVSSGSNGSSAASGSNSDEVLGSGATSGSVSSSGGSASTGAPVVNMAPLVPSFSILGGTLNGVGNNASGSNQTPSNDSGASQSPEESNGALDSTNQGGASGKEEGGSDIQPDNGTQNKADATDVEKKAEDDSLSLAKALGGEPDAATVKAESDSAQGEQVAADNQVQQGNRLSQTNDSMKGLIIAMAAIAVAALSVIGVVVFRMTHRRDDR